MSLMIQQKIDFLKSKLNLIPDLEIKGAVLDLIEHYENPIQKIETIKKKVEYLQGDWCVIDMIYTEEEGNIVKIGSYQDCLDYLDDQGGFFGYKIIPYL